MNSFLRLLLAALFLTTSPVFGAFSSSDSVAKSLQKDKKIKISQRVIFKDTQLCSDVLDGTWPIIQDGISYEIRLAEDPIDGFHPVLIRIPVNANGSYKKNKDGTVNRSIKPLTMDDLTDTFLASEVMVKKVMNLLIENARRKREKMAFVFIDINDLNKVNNFVNKQVDGDAYVSKVSEAVRTVCQMMDSNGEWCSVEGKERKHEVVDWVFRDGGDELVLLVPNVKAHQLVQIMERIRGKLLFDSEIHAIFERQREHTRKRLNKALSKLSESTQESIENLLEINFTTFEELRQELAQIGIKSKPLLELMKDFDTARRLHPSVSMGSTFIGRKDDYNSLKKRTSEQAYQVKSAYKRKMGLDAEKYGAIEPGLEEESFEGDLPVIDIRKPLPPHN